MTERILVAGKGAERMKLQLHLDKLALEDFVYELAPWQVISHLTFRWEVGLDAGRRAYERFMARGFPELSYFYALEENPCRDGFHVHALWADAKTLYRKEAWAAWFKRFGRARIEPVKDRGDVTSYCAKYVTKEVYGRGWWNVKLQWHRVQAQRGEPFVLERDTRLPVPQHEFGFTKEVFNLAADPQPGAGEGWSPARVEDRSQVSKMGAKSVGRV